MKMKSIPHFRILITITVLFTLLITTFGTVLAVYVYEKSSTLLLKISEQYFDQIRQELTMDYKSMRKTVAQTVRIIAHTEIVNARNLEERLRFVPLIYSALEKEQKLTALQFGYDNGDYFIVRSLNNEYMAERFESPDQAAVVVDNITTSPDGLRYRSRFWFTDSMVRIGKDNTVMVTYDPRVRPWYKAALASDSVTDTAPYLFHFIGQMGFTVAYKPFRSDCVVAGDITLQSLSQILTNHTFSERTEIVLFENKDNDLWVTAYRDADKLLARGDQQVGRSRLKDLESEILDFASSQNNFHTPFFTIRHKGEDWLGSTHRLNVPHRENFYLAMLSPEKDILKNARTMQMQTSIFTFAMIVLAGPFTWLLARKISRPLQQLARNTQRISRFEFTQGNRFAGSTIKEVDDLGQAMSKMEMTIDQFISLINSLASEQDFDKLLKRISEETMQIGEADGAFTYVVSTTVNKLSPGSIHTQQSCLLNDGLLPEYDLEKSHRITDLLHEREPVIGNLDELLPGNTLSDAIGIQTPIAVIFPAVNRQGDAIGLLCLLYQKEKFGSSEDQKGRLAFLKALSGFAAVTLESRQMLRMQKDLLESFIKVLADAIDSKSAYTGGHCKRVPVITQLIAQKACESNEEPFRRFNLDDAKWEELRIASWLHDCGKVTSPEFVVDKATKLETIYDRIHEIRMRFEVLKRDAHIHLLEQFSTCNNEEELQRQLNQRWKDLDEEFSFIAKCNIGGEYMATEKMERLREIGSQTWKRTISDRLGISWEERMRKDRRPEPQLPVDEQLIADRYDHLIPREEKQKIHEENPYGFILNTPEYQYNRGELYNLSIPKGTLTSEDRYQINDHIVQTIIMLKKLPFPKHLSHVPDIAGGHHEKLDGTGYPRKLTADKMSQTARIMVLADIFEALTATDRPYKDAKKLSESLNIMSRMVVDGHIDPDLFQLFLTSGAYLEYAEKYLKEEQIDTVDIGKLLEEV